MEAAWRHTDTLIFQSRYQEILLLVQDDPLEDLMRVSEVPEGGRGNSLCAPFVCVSLQTSLLVARHFDEEERLCLLSSVGEAKCPVISESTVSAGAFARYLIFRGSAKMKPRLVRSICPA